MLRFRRSSVAGMDRVYRNGIFLGFVTAEVDGFVATVLDGPNGRFEGRSAVKSVAVGAALRAAGY